MELVGLTGGIGSGKSTVAARLREHGCEVIDADAVAREIVAPGEATLDDLVARFGPGILREDGSLHRQELARVAFADDDARADLDRITHPRIAARIAERIAQIGAAADARPGEVIVVDHPLLVETGQTGRFDAVLVVLADEELRVRRLVESRGLTEEDVRARIRAQVDDEARRRVATHVIRNEGSVEELRAQVDAIHTELVAKGRHGREAVTGGGAAAAEG
jgi:dephospho-CoA kinase